VPIHKRYLVEKQKQYSKVLRLTQITDMVSRARMSSCKKNSLGYDLVWMKDDDKKSAMGIVTSPLNSQSEQAKETR
jgi:hypothetical protein